MATRPSGWGAGAPGGGKRQCRGRPGRAPHVFGAPGAQGVDSGVRKTFLNVFGGRSLPDLLMD